MQAPPLQIAFICDSGKIPANWKRIAAELGWRLQPSTPMALRDRPPHDLRLTAAVFCLGSACGGCSAGEGGSCNVEASFRPSIEEVRALVGELPLIVVLSNDAPITAARAMVRGASLSLPPDLHDDELISLLQEAQSSPWLSPPFCLCTTDACEDPMPEIICESDAMRRVKTHILQWARLDQPGGDTLPILLHGESGTGKSMVARAAHRAGRRREGPFVVVRCHGRTRDELEAELFGALPPLAVEKPSSRDRRSSDGALAKAQGGTLFLEEITELTSDAQARLVRILEQGLPTTDGRSPRRPLDFRLIAATNADLPRLIATGRFRADLFHRIDCLTLQLPPLRERGNDVALLAHHFLGELSERRGGPPLCLTAGALRELRSYPWPGNVRELRNALQRAAAHSRTHNLGPAALGLNGWREAGDSPRNNANGHTRRHRRSGGTSPIQVGATTISVDFDNVSHIDFDEIRREIIRQAVEHAGGNQAEAARCLNMTRNSIRYAVKKYGLPLHDDGE